MSSEDAPIVDYDSERALAEARELAGVDAVLVCAEYDTEDFRLLHVDERVEAKYDSFEDLVEAGELFHRYGQVDFFEGDTVSGFYEPLEETRAFVTYTDFAILCRILGDREALYLSVEPGTAVTPLVDAMTEIVAGDA
jgi:hypothetical protein